MIDDKPKLATVDFLPGKRWNAHAALGDAMQRASMDAPMVVMWLEGKEQKFCYAIANSVNLQTLWMAEMLRDAAKDPTR